jgi:hypothetical protein
MQEPSEAMKIALSRRRRYLFERHNICERLISKLEPVASAIDKDRYYHRNTQLSQIFKEQIALAKKELKEITHLEEYEPYLFTTELNEIRNWGLIFFSNLF